MTSLLQVNDVTVRFGHFTAVDEVSIGVQANTIHSVIGPNGAGKTTLFNSLCGVNFPTSGTVVLDGRDVTKAPLHRRVDLGMSKSFQITSVFPQLSVKENLRIAVDTRSRKRFLDFWSCVDDSAAVLDHVAALLDEVGLTEKGHLAARDLAHGDQRALEVGLAIAGNPKIVFLDEPLAGMGNEDIARMRDILASLRRRCAVVLIEHNMSFVVEVSDTITVMHQGKVLMTGSPDEVKADPRVAVAYLGEKN